MALFLSQGAYDWKFWHCMLHLITEVFPSTAIALTTSCWVLRATEVFFSPIKSQKHYWEETDPYVSVYAVLSRKTYSPLLDSTRLTLQALSHKNNGASLSLLLHNDFHGKFSDKLHSFVPQVQAFQTKIHPASAMQIKSYAFPPYTICKENVSFRPYLPKNCWFTKTAALMFPERYNLTLFKSRLRLIWPIYLA